MISVRISSSPLFFLHRIFELLNAFVLCYLGLISQVAEDLWEVADKTIINLTKKDISITDYKKNLVKQSNAAIEKAKLFSKSAVKGRT
jgi:hypothetical protein